MPLLKAEPPAPVRSMDELLAIAFAMESEAAARYEELAGQMAAGGNEPLAAVFRDLAQQERGHIGNVETWSQKATGGPPRLAAIAWELPQTFDLEGIDSMAPALASAYRSLAMAVRNEERAFAFWSYVAAQAPSEEIRRAAETMAHEELEHVAILRRARRQAFHRARPAPRGAAGSVEEAEAKLGRILGAAAREADAALRPRYEAEAQSAAEAVRRLSGGALGRAALDGIPSDDPLILSEALVETYLSLAESAPSEAEVALGQSLAAMAIRRHAVLRALAA